MAGAPLGNDNRAKGKMFYDALRKALVQNPHRLDKITDTLITAAEAGEAWAVKEIMDRMDGKAVQVTQMENADGTPLLAGIQVSFIKPSE